jgi:hypothetical protein
MIERADRAARFARDARKFHARRTSATSTQRQTDLEVARDRLREAMEPIRARVRQIDRNGDLHNERPKLMRASAALQRERRKLHKMLPKGHDVAA